MILRYLVLLVGSLALISCSDDDKRGVSAFEAKLGGSWSSCEISFDNVEREYKVCTAYKFEGASKQERDLLAQSMKAVCDIQGFGFGDLPANTDSNLPPNIIPSVSAKFYERGLCSGALQEGGCLSITRDPAGGMSVHELTVNRGETFEESKEACEDLQSLSETSSSFDDVTVEWVEI